MEQLKRFIDSYSQNIVGSTNMFIQGFNEVYKSVEIEMKKKDDEILKLKKENEELKKANTDLSKENKILQEALKNTQK